MIDRQKVIRKLLRDFVKEDKSDPFMNREYVEETKRIYKLLMLPDGHGGDTKNTIDNTIFDIAMDIFRYMEKHNTIFW